MGAGIDPKTLHRWIYKRLYAIRLKLCAANICYSYRNLEIYGGTFAIYYAGCGPASNGESCHWPVLRFNPDQPPEGCRKKAGDHDYGGLGNPSFEDGLAMLVSRAREAQAVEQGLRDDAARLASASVGSVGSVPWQ